LPDPAHIPVPESVQFDEDWRGYLAGVGGMGINSATSVLVRAAMHHGYHITFCDKKGIAVRNGGVYSALTFSKTKKVVSPLLPQGKVNLLLGLDILEAARGLDPRLNFRVGSKEYTHSIVNTHKTHTILSLLGKDDFSPNALADVFKKYTIDYFGTDMSQIAENFLGNKVFVNILLLGVAFQRGLLPLTLEDMLAGIKANFDPRAARHNIDAFHLGRDLAANPAKYNAEVREGFREVFEKKSRILSRSSFGFLRANGDPPVHFGSSSFKWMNSIGLFRAKPYREMVWQFFKAWEGDDETRLQFVNRLYDLIQFQDASYAKKYFDRVMATLKKDSKNADYAATKAVVKYLHKVMEIKDEVYVAHLLTSPEKYEKDAKRYKVDLAAGEKIIYKHFNRPHFDILGLKIEFNFNSRDWMLKIMKHMKILRLLMPAWHKREKAFRQWYMDMVDRFDATKPEKYDRWVRVFNLPEEVRGYRTVRYPKMERAMTLADNILTGKEIPQMYKPTNVPKQFSKV